MGLFHPQVKQGFVSDGLAGLRKIRALPVPDRAAVPSIPATNQLKKPDLHSAAEAPRARDHQHI